MPRKHLTTSMIETPCTTVVRYLYLFVVAHAKKAYHANQAEGVQSPVREMGMVQIQLQTDEERSFLGEISRQITGQILLQGQAATSHQGQQVQRCCSKGRSTFARCSCAIAYAISSIIIIISHLLLLFYSDASAHNHDYYDGSSTWILADTSSKSDDPISTSSCQWHGTLHRIDLDRYPKSCVQCLYAPSELAAISSYQGRTHQSI